MKKQLFIRPVSILLFLLLPLFGWSEDSCNPRMPQEFYEEILQELEEYPHWKNSLYECPCLPGLVRKKNKEELHKSLRGILDAKVYEYFGQFNKQGTMPSRPVALFFGSGRLFNELTVVASILKQQPHLHIILVDTEYATKFKTSIDIFKNVVHSLSHKSLPPGNVQIDTFISMKDALHFLQEKDLSVNFYFMLDSYFVPQRCLDILLDTLKDFPIQGEASVFILAKTTQESTFLNRIHRPRDIGVSLHLYEISLFAGQMTDSKLIYDLSGRTWK